MDIEHLHAEPGYRQGGLSHGIRNIVEFPVEEEGSAKPMDVPDDLWGADCR